jgi:enoyl-CoA hydratase/carnithine racemase
MVQYIFDALAVCLTDSTVRALLITKSGDSRAFCAGNSPVSHYYKGMLICCPSAGGDVRGLAGSSTFEYPHAFLEAEYNMNYALSRFSKPCVSLWDGFTMGGGVGASIYGDFRICTENTVVRRLHWCPRTMFSLIHSRFVQFAMPECQIGLIPDVGASFFLPQVRGL